jgi:polyphosphate kinase 2
MSETVDAVPKLGKKEYKKALRERQIELVKFQRHLIETGGKLLVVFEGRDAAGKDGVIKRIVRHLSPRETRVVALGKPSDRETSSWYFQRWVAYLPSSQEFVLFNRSWYNRAGVERVMGFCSDQEHEQFMRSVLDFERMLVESGIMLLKYYLDISRGEQEERLADRREDPLKQWKVSPIDARALENWAAYSTARNEMLTRTHSEHAPWTIVRADRKRAARLNVIQDLLRRFDYQGKRDNLLTPSPDVVFDYGDLAARGRLCP